MKAWKISVIVAAVFIAVIISLYIHALHNISIEDIQVNDLQDVSLKGFVFGGNIFVHNGGFLPVGIDKIEYNVVLEDSGKELANGIVNGTLVMPQKTASFPFSNSIKWVPTAEIAWNLINRGNTYVKVTGTLTVIDWSFLEINIPFEKRVDLKPYIIQFAKQKIQQAAENLPQAINQTAQRVVQWIQQI